MPKVVKGFLKEMTSVDVLRVRNRIIHIFVVNVFVKLIILDTLKHGYGFGSFRNVGYYVPGDK